MPIPKEILAVKRPVNTFVIVYGKNKDRYAVRERLGCKYKEGRRIPINGKTIGHIVDGKYIPKENKEKISQSKIDLKDWGCIEICNQLFKKVLEDLLKIYDYADALKIYCIVILRVCYPGIKDHELKEAYDSSFLSEIYPGVGLSKNTVSKFLKSLGKAYSKIVKFMRTRVEKMEINGELLVDGTLKTNNSKINSLSEFSRKSRVKGDKNISVIYAFDLEKKEPVCSKCYPGNMLDLTAYENFIKENKITKGMIIADKGFPSSAAIDEFERNENLHYLNPIKRNSKFISTHNMLDFEEILPEHSEITCKKEKCNCAEKWLYSFRNSVTAAKEEQDYLRRKQENFDKEDFKKKQKQFGTIVLECDLDLGIVKN